MSILTTFFKQPNDVQDYDVDFTAWLAGFSPADTGLSKSVSVDTGITLQSSVLNSGVVKVWLSGGTTGTTYKVTVALTTTGGRTKEVEFRVSVKDT